MGACMDKKNSIFFSLVINIYGFFLHMVHEKKMKKWKFKQQGANILGVINYVKMQHLYAYFHKLYTLNKWKH
jgi:hypothetical protein